MSVSMYVKHETGSARCASVLICKLNGCFCLEYMIKVVHSENINLVLQSYYFG